MRLFLGCPIGIAPRLETVAREVAHGGRITRPGTWHITLRFLGEADAEDVVEAMQGFQHEPLDCRVQGVGAFQSGRRARVVYARVDAPGLMEVEKEVRGRTEAIGQSPGGRAFVPHVTLARMRRPTDVSAQIRRHRGTMFWQGSLDRVVLYRSVLGPGGSRHEVLRAWPFTSS